MKKTFGLFVLILFVFSFGYGQTVSFMPAWQVGETHTYSFSVIKSKYKMVDGEPFLTSSDTGSYNAHFEVIEVGDDHYRIKMTKELEDLMSILDTMKTMKLFYRPENYKNLDVIYSTNRNGELQEIDNWEEIAENMRLLCDSLLSPLYEDYPVLENVMLTLKSRYSSQESIRQFEFKELQLLHWLFGAEMEVGYSYPYQETLPNMWDPSTPLRASSVTGIDTLMTDQSICRVKRYSYINEKDAKKLVMNVIKMLASFGGKKSIKEAKGMKMTITDDYTFDYSTLEHMPVYINAQRATRTIVKNEDAMQVEERIIKLLE
ncbi:MAG: hypothetical protein IKR71_06325 [Bacteroidales bacterium]|nr:hypothetical protein [Bacteroidales bacterium]